MSQLFRLKNGTVLLSTEAPGGIYNSGQLKKIAELCSKELAIVKATEDQRLALFVKESEVDNVAQQLRAMGLGFRHYQDNLHQPVSCLGELCEEHEQPAMATAMDITKEIASIQLKAPLKIGLNGCARCCTPCHTLDIAVVGDSSGYRISLGGRTKQMPEFASYFAEGVPPKELPKRLKAVIEAYRKLAEDGETLHDVIERCGVTDFVQALAPYSQDAAHREDPFAKATEAPVDLGSVAADEERDVEDELSLETEDAPTIADDELLNDDGAITDELEEIPIEREDQGLLEDDLSLEDSPEDLGSDIAVESAADDLSLESELEFEDDAPAEAPAGDALADDELSLTSDDVELSLTEDEAPVALDELEEEALADELNPADDQLSLDGDDLSLTDDVTLDDKVAAEADELSLDDESVPETDELSLDDEAVPETDELSLDDEVIPEADELSLDDDVVPEADELSLDDEAVPETDELTLDDDSGPGEDDVLSFEGDADLDLGDDTASVVDDTSAEDLDLSEASANIPEDDIELDDADLAMPADPSLDEAAELELDESLNPDDDLIADLDDGGMDLSETPLDEDLEGIPELDEDLSPEEIPAPLAAPAPAPKSSPQPVSAAKVDDFGEDEMHADVPDFSDEEESAFEEKLQASIDEESRLIAKADKDPNSGDRQAALNLLEQDTLSLEESSEAEEELIDEELEPINESMEEFPEPGPKDLAHIKARQHGQKLQGSSQNQQFKLSAIAVQDDHMRVTFESGAYVDFDLSALGLGEERSFRLGTQNVSVTSTSEGFILEVDGMRLFHPKSSLPVAS